MFGNVSLYFWKRCFTRLVLLFEFPRYLWNDFGMFSLSIISISFIWVENSVPHFYSIAFIENLKSYRSGTTSSTLPSRKLERSSEYLLISISFSRLLLAVRLMLIPPFGSSGTAQSSRDETFCTSTLLTDSNRENRFTLIFKVTVSLTFLQRID